MTSCAPKKFPKFQCLVPETLGDAISLFSAEIFAKELQFRRLVEKTKIRKKTCAVSFGPWNQSLDKFDQVKMHPEKCCFCVELKAGVRTLGLVLVCISAFAIVAGVIVINQVNYFFSGKHRFQHLRWQLCSVGCFLFCLLRQSFRNEWKVFETLTYYIGGGLRSTKVAFLRLTQWPQVRFLAFQKIYFNVAEIDWQRWLEESGKRLDNVNRTHLVLAS